MVIRIYRGLVYAPLTAASALLMAALASSRSTSFARSLAGRSSSPASRSSNCIAARRSRGSPPPSGQLMEAASPVPGHADRPRRLKGSMPHGGIVEESQYSYD